MVKKSLIGIGLLSVAISVPGTATAERWCALERNGVCIEWRGDDAPAPGQNGGQVTPPIPKPEPPAKSQAERIEDALAINRSDRRRIQQALTSLGYDTRGIDGIFGNGTRGAIRNWQNKRGYGQTGFLNRLQRDALLAVAAERNRADPNTALRARISGNTLRYWWADPPTTYGHFTRSGKISHRKRSGEILKGSWKILTVGGKPALCTWYEVTGDSRFCYHFENEGTREKLLFAEGSKRGERSRGVSFLRGDPQNLARHVR